MFNVDGMPLSYSTAHQPYQMGCLNMALHQHDQGEGFLFTFVNSNL